MAKNKRAEELGRKLVDGARRAVKTEPRKRTYIMFLLDRSGSMVKGKELTIKGYNEQVRIVQDNADAGGQTLVSLMMVCDEVPEFSYVNQPASRLTVLHDSTYIPGGGTPLYDAIGMALDRAATFDGIEDEETAVLLAVFTDGEDTTSRVWLGRCQELGRRVAALQESGRWTFTLMGPKSGLGSLADLLRIDRTNVAGFDPGSLVSRGEAMTAMAAATGTYLSARAAGATQVRALYTPHGDLGEAK